MKNSNLVYLALSKSGPSNVSIFFTLKTKGMDVGGRCLTHTEGVKEAEDLENLFMAVLQIDLA
jgi:hypothetical protein